MKNLIIVCLVLFSCAAFAADPRVGGVPVLPSLNPNATNFTAISKTTNYPVIVRNTNDAVVVSVGSDGTYRLYKTNTDASNYERLSIGYDGLRWGIKDERAGTGGPQSFYLTAGGYFIFGGGDAFQWAVQGGAGHFTAWDDNSYDIGNAGAGRPRIIRAASGFASFATNVITAIGSTGWTNILGVNTIVEIDGTAVTYSIYNSGGTSVYTNPVALAHSTAILQPGGKVLISGTGVTGFVRPF